VSMKRIVNLLIQLQELHYAKLEQQASLPQSRIKNLQEAMDALIKDLPPEMASLYREIQRRYTAAVVPAADGVCSGCSMSLPTILYQEVLEGQTIEQCPACSRILYYLRGAPRQTRPDPKKIPPRPSAGIARFSSEHPMIPQINADKREYAIKEMVDFMSGAGFVESQEGLLKAVLQREDMVTTAMKYGLAFPHVRGIEGGGLTFALGLKKKGLNFAPDGRLTRIVFLIVIPSVASVFFLQLLSGLIETFREAEARKVLLSCKKPEDMWEVLIELTKETIR